VTSRRIEQLGWTDRGTAEMKSERCDVQESVCMQVDIISHTCPCHSGSSCSSLLKLSFYPAERKKTLTFFSTGFILAI